MSENNGLRKGSRSRATGAPGAISSECWPLVLVRWVDSTSPRMGWIRLSEWGGVGSGDVGVFERSITKMKNIKILQQGRTGATTTGILPKHTLS